MISTAEVSNHNQSIMKIVSWNVNSIRVRLNQFLDFLKNYSPDVVLLQELKCEEKNFPFEQIEELGYQVAISGQKTFNGVGIVSKYKIEDISYDFFGNPDPSQARYIEALINFPNNTLTNEMFPSSIVRVASVYIPNGMEVGSDKFGYKLNFLKAFIQHCKLLRSYRERLIIGGDFNVAPDDIDVYDHRQLNNQVCFSYTERQLFWELINLDLFDSFRLKYPEKKEYSWWDYRAGALQNDLGMRIDHILLSPEIADYLSDVQILKSERTKEKASDHAPIMAIL